MESSRRAPLRSSLILSAAFAGLVLLSGLGSARAQYFYEQDLIMPPRAVVWRLNDRGFTEVSRPRFDGRAYIVEASGPYGGRVRLFVDARDGAILGRQRLDVAVAPPPARIARPAPGYGWTEDDAAPLPFEVGRSGGAARSEPADRNPLGVNPDARTRAEPPRKVVRLTPPAKPAVPRVTPEAPKPVEAKPIEAAIPAAPPKPEPPGASLEAPRVVAPSPTPAAVQPPPTEKTPAAQTWKDPNPEKKPVRVIGGATIVPGAGEREPAAAE